MGEGSRAGGPPATNWRNFLAITPRDNEAFYREVDEEVRRDQLKSYWQRYGKATIAGMVLLIAALGGFFWWQQHKEVKAGEQGAELSSAFEDIAARNKTAALPKLDRLAKSDTPGYRVAAQMTKADLAIEAGDLAAAAAAFRAIAGDDDYAKPYRELATIRLTALEFDRLPPQTVIDRLKLHAVPGNPWFGSAGEMVAISYLKLNKPRDAARIFAAMAKDQKVPESIRSRAVQMAGSLGVDAIQDASGATGETKQ
jgi:hypothetical protein